jgi:hypothetical protein
LAELAALTDEIRVGQPLPFDILNANGVLLLARGQIVGSATQLAQLIERGATVEEAEVERVRAVKAAHPDRPFTLFDLWAQAPTRLEQLLAGIAEPGFAGRLDRFAADFVALARRDVDIAIYLTIRQDAARLQRYGLSHALHTALAAELAAARLGWPDADRLRFVKAALTMNLAIVVLQGRLAASDTRLTEAQRDSLRAHPQAAVNALAAAGIEDPLWLEAIAQHHERADGSGYPAGLRLQVRVQFVDQRDAVGDVQADDVGVADAVEVLHQRADAVAVRGDHEALAAGWPARALVPARQHARHGVLQALGQRHLLGRERRSAGRRAGRAGRPGSSAGGGVS